jgi:hypothetical protein
MIGALFAIAVLFLFIFFLFRKSTPVNSSDGKNLRMLTTMEHIYARLHEHKLVKRKKKIFAKLLRKNFDNTQRNGFIHFTYSLKGSVSPALIKAAIEMIQKQQPVFQLSYHKTNDNWHYRELPNYLAKIQFKVVKKSKKDDWKDFLSSELNSALPPVPQGELSWKVTFFYDPFGNLHELILSAFHASVDGKTGLNFGKDLLENLTWLFEKDYSTSALQECQHLKDFEKKTLLLHSNIQDQFIAQNQHF